MNIFKVGAIALAVTGSVGAHLLPETSSHLSTLYQRALPNSPNGYTPTTLDCPSTPPSIRSAEQLSPNETAWLETRRTNTVAPMRDFLTRMNISGFDAGSYVDSISDNTSALPNIGLAFSGGGWRALLAGAGVLKAFDSRTENSTNTGQLGGLFQSSTYVAGLSGGSWLVGSIYINNFTTVGALQSEESGSVWEFGNSVLEGPDESGIQILNTAGYYGDIIDSINGKRDAGFGVSLTDPWGRGLSFQMFNVSDGAASYTWSSIAQTASFQNADVPFPIVVSDARAPGESLISLNATVYEINPFELGTWDPRAFGFAPLQYVGTNFTAGAVDSTSECVVGFDNAGFIIGTSSSLFNQILLNINYSSTSIPSTLQSTITSLLSNLDQDNNDIADYTPNPFYQYNPTTNPNANNTRLTLVDGGEDLQNIPLHPLIQPNRNLSVIFAIDSSADTPLNWPNGTSLVATYERSLSPISNGTSFPAIPDVNTFVNLGLNTRPTFFGCDASNTSSPTPLIVYIPNSPYVTFSNESTFTLSTNNTYRDAVILNGQYVATLANGTLDPIWPTCVGCAVLSRSFDATGTQVPEGCRDCFERYCWDGSLNSTTPAGEYEPGLKVGGMEVELENSGAALGRSTLGFTVGFVIVVGAVSGFLF